MENTRTSRRGQEAAFTRRLLIYIPAYNCGGTIEGVIRSIPPAMWDVADVLVVDNQSTDDTVERVVRLNDSGELPRSVSLVQPQRNLGYAGSQKLAYKLAMQSEAVQWVVMLHGDGQYPPEFLEKFLQQGEAEPEAAAVYGYRDKKVYPQDEETPRLTYAIIRTLSLFESLVTGVWRKEWHSGYVMYSTRFLRRVDLASMTDTMHLDGHFQYAVSALGEKSIPLPIFKRYRELEAFAGWDRIKYVMQVLWMSFMFRFQQVAADEGIHATIPAYHLLDGCNDKSHMALSQAEAA